MWIFETDGLSRVQGGGASMVLRTPKGSTILQSIKLAFVVSNNEAEYKAVLLGLKVVK